MARAWRRLWGGETREEVPEGGRVTAARARFWAQVREGEREAEALCARQRP